MKITFRPPTPYAAAKLVFRTSSTQVYPNIIARDISNNLRSGTASLSVGLPVLGECDAGGQQVRQWEVEVTFDEAFAFQCLLVQSKIARTSPVSLAAR